MHAENRYPHIDAMRAIAALAVATVHISESLAPLAGSGTWLHQMADDMRFGATGVTLFFLVSGFLIPSSFGNHPSRAEGLRIFAIRRFFRLYPAYWLSIPLALWSTWWLHDRPIDVATVLANVTMFQRVLGFEDIEGLYWTLAYELVFYLACAGLYVLGVQHRPAALLGVLYVLLGVFAVIAALGLRPTGYLRFFSDLPVSVGLMFTGAVLRHWHDRLPLGRWAKAALVIILLIYVLPMLRGLKIADGQATYTFTPDWGPGLGVLIFLLLAMRLRLSHPLLSWLGTISYSLYLFHPVIIYFFTWLLLQPGFEWARGWDLLAYFGPILAVTILFSAGVYRWLELPMIELGRRLTRRAAPQVSPGPVVAG